MGEISISSMAWLSLGDQMVPSPHRKTDWRSVVVRVPSDVNTLRKPGSRCFQSSPGAVWIQTISQFSVVPELSSGINYFFCFGSNIDFSFLWIIKAFKIIFTLFYFWSLSGCLKDVHQGNQRSLKRSSATLEESQRKVHSFHSYL